MIKDILSSASSLQNYSFAHTLRHGNALAHALAKKVRFSFPSQVWIEPVPQELYNCYVSNSLSI